MKVIMNMSNYEIEYETIEEEYGDEILHSGWNPEVDTMCQQLQLVQSDETQTVPEGVAAGIAGLFLRKMYTYQR